MNSHNNGTIVKIKERSGILYKFETGINEKEYEEFALNHPLYNLLQSSKWSEIKTSWGNEKVGLYKNDKLVGAASILIKRLPMGFTMMYIPRGPLLTYENRDEVVFFMKELKKWASKKRCLFVKMDPGIHINDYKIEDANEERYDVSEILDNMSAAGTKHLGYPKTISDAIQARYQANVYKKDNFVNELPNRTKRMIKNATKRDVQIARYDASHMKKFSDLVELTEERQHVNLRSKEYFDLLMNTYGDDCWLYLATLNIKDNLENSKKDKIQNDKDLAETKEESRKRRNTLIEKGESIDKYIEEFTEYYNKYGETAAIAGALSIRYGNTIEVLYAGMNDDFKKLMPQYYLYADMMETAFENGVEFVNMGGVEGTLDDGLTRFKANFDPMINEFIGEFDLPTSILYPIGKKAFEMYRKKSND